MRGLHISTGLQHRLAAVGLAILLLTLTGPFGTFVDLSAPLRLVYWTVAVGGCSIFMFLAMEALPLFPGWPASARMAAGGMIGAIPGAGLVALLELVLRGSEEFVADYFWFWFCIAGAGVVVTFLRFLILRQAAGRELVLAPAAPEAPFLDRLPRDIGRELVSLSMQDHYVEATTTRGTALVLIRFGDALGELAGYPGAQVHRSHWVAAGKARSLCRDGSRTFLDLVDGRRLPVSRPYLERARRLAEAPSPPEAGAAGRASVESA